MRVSYREKKMGFFKKRFFFLIFLFMIGFFPFPSAAKVDWSARPLDVPSEITMEAGSRLQITLHYKNIGKKDWRRFSKHFVAMNVAKPTGRASAFQDSTWKEFYYRPNRVQQNKVKPGNIGRFKLTLNAPDKPGTYKESFTLVSENLTFLKNSEIQLTIRVTPKPEPPETDVPPSPPTISLGEPAIRVGLFATEDEEEILPRGASATLTLLDGTGVAEIPKDTAVFIGFANDRYHLRSATFDLTTPYAPRLTVESVDAILEIRSYEHRPAWNPKLNDNTFRGALELRHSETTGRTWMINELPMESYLRGIAEASDDDSPEYLKALFIAARTYALYHLQTNTKHDEEFFIVDATNDQVYRGYAFEQRAPNITQIVEATRGLAVTYENEIVVTPYFSHTDGRTRSWEEVWGGGPYAWLVTKPDPCCTDKTLLGHGVGLSALGAKWFVEEKQWTYDQILTYYYTGIAITRIY